MEIKLTEEQIRAGEERAFRLFQERLAANGTAWIRRDKAMRYRGLGRAMIRRVYYVARHIEGSKVSRSLGKRGVDSVSLTSVRSALHRVGNGLVRIKRTRGRVSTAGGTLARWIHKSR